LSYRRAHEPTLPGGSATVTVCTHDVALGHLIQDRVPTSVAKSRRDGEDLVTSVVELEHERIGFTAIDARARAEKLDQVLRPLYRQPPFAPIARSM